jgi:hypothetical protein
MATAHTIQLVLDNLAINHAIAECYQAIFNRDIAPDTSSSKVSTLSVLKGGKSKVYVQNRVKPLLQLSREQPNHFC